MNVLFIYSMKESKSATKPLTSQTGIQFGISYISSLLKTHNHKTDLLVLTYKSPKTLIDNTIKKFLPRLICFTGVYSEYDFIKEIAHYIKSHYSSIFLIAGGPHVSLNPETTINDSFDAICLGEGEYPVLELVNQIEKDNKITGIRNLWIKDKGKIEKNQTREFYQELDNLPFPDREMWQKWITSPNKKHEIIMGRGCPFQCTYCCNHALKKISKGKYVRFRTPDNVIKELENIVEKFPHTEEVYFEVETIGAKMQFAMELCSRLVDFNTKLNKRIIYGVNLRIIPGVDYENLFENLYKASFRYIKIGLESGSDRVRKETLRRYYSNKDIISAFKLAKKYNIKTSTFVMVGLPGETLEDFKDTIKCIREGQPDRASLSIFYPYPGTELYKICQEKKLLNNKNITIKERKIATLDLPNFPRKEIQKQYDWFPYNIYKGKKSLISLLRRVFYRRVSSFYNTYIL